ncbi:MAG: hypothetical protein IJU42_07605 [Erysipelotrichaceae bacterium]|jgi:Na+-transporting methylmalonyl-CoA/oxaloacetate decarboxylase gamma subunit|nr:hypothetical protein [Erysipelotrichaceae bacterium]
MKLLKKLVGFIALALVVGGSFVLLWQYFRNKQLFVVLLSNSIVKGSIGVLQKMGMAIIAIFLGLIMFVLYMKIGSVVRRNEREKREALKVQQKENEALQRQLKKEAEEAKAEAEQAKKETELMKMTFMRKEEEAEGENKEAE